MAQYNWRTSGAVSIMTKTKGDTMINNKQKEIGYCGCSFCKHNKKNGKKYDMHVKELK
tara:strand:- start:1503 stop:1676 length:174 start_codon:yes stop_codon:yes gene_type:complete